MFVVMPDGSPVDLPDYIQKIGLTREQIGLWLDQVRAANRIRCPAGYWVIHVSGMSDEDALEAEMTAGIASACRSAGGQ